MAEIATVNQDKVDTALITSGASKVYYKSAKVAFVTSQIASHGGHNSATITGGSSKVYVEGKKLARKGDLASCGHTIVTGRTNTSST